MADNPAGLENMVEATPDSVVVVESILNYWKAPDLLNNFASKKQKTFRPVGSFDKNASVYEYDFEPETGGLIDMSSLECISIYRVMNADGSKPKSTDIVAPVAGAPLTFWKGITFSSGNTTIEGNTETAYMKNYVQLLMTGKIFSIFSFYEL